MPTYQYACTECGHAFEQFQSFTDDSLTECPECSGRLRKLFNAVGVVFKGSGFYRTDSRGPETSSSGSSGSEKKSDGGSEKKSETTTPKKSDSSSSSSSGSSSSSSSTSGKAAASSS